jgi:phosphatidyl-myo-inositol dimannoside synthase
MKDFLVVAHGISRLGGIEEVSRQVICCLGQHPELRISKLEVGFSILNRIRAALVLTLWLLRHKPVVIMHAAILERYVPGLVLRWTRSSIVVWAHGIEVWGEYGKRKTSKLQYATKAIAVSEFTRDKLKKNFPSLSVSVINNSIDHALYDLSAPSLRSKQFEILTVGRLSIHEGYKGHNLVIDAVALLKQRKITVHYNIVGTGDALENLINYAESKGVANLVEFHGYIDDSKITSIYARSSLFVMPSFVVERDNDEWSGEGFGLVYLEAAAHGLPSIACREGGQVDAVIDGVTGTLINPCVTELAGALEDYYLNPTKLKKVASAAKKNCLENHNQKIFKENLVRELL